MKRLEALRKKVQHLYETKNPKRAAAWTDFLYHHHIFVTEKYAIKLAKRFDVNVELCRAGSILHDIADAVMDRKAKGHHEKSLEIAKEFLEESGYTKNEVEILVGDALPNHDCRDAFPKTDVGKVLSTADALAHFQTDFILYYFSASVKQGMSFEDAKKRAVGKLDKDYKIKILYPEIKRETKEEYQALHKLFSR